MFIVRIMIVMEIGNDTALLPQQYQTNIAVKRHKVGGEMRKIEVKWLLNGRLFEGGAAKNGAAAPNIML